jgi:hypothetical protein
LASGAGQRVAVRPKMHVGDSGARQAVVDRWIHRGIAPGLAVPADDPGRSRVAGEMHDVSSGLVVLSEDAGKDRGSESGECPRSGCPGI